MNERRDDTTKPSGESRREPGRYYYDDATGYEPFDPETDDDDDDEADGGTTEEGG